jgi:chromosome segregation ATPase
MTDERTLSLDDVRERFVEARAQLADASSSIGAIREAAQSLGQSRESLLGAGSRITELAERFGAVADAMAENAERLREGVDAIRLGDPAAIRRQIEELDAAFTALQSVSGERLTRIEAAMARLEQQLGSGRRQAMILAVATMVVVVIAVVVAAFLW